MKKFDELFWSYNHKPVEEIYTVPYNDRLYVMNKYCFYMVSDSLSELLDNHVENVSLSEARKHIREKTGKKTAKFNLVSTLVSEQLDAIMFVLDSCVETMLRLQPKMMRIPDHVETEPPSANSVYIKHKNIFYQVFENSETGTVRFMNDNLLEALNEFYPDAEPSFYACDNGVTAVRTNTQLLFGAATNNV